MILSIDTGELNKDILKHTGNLQYHLTDIQHEFEDKYPGLKLDISIQREVLPINDCMPPKERIFATLKAIVK